MNLRCQWMSDINSNQARVKLGVRQMNRSWLWLLLLAVAWTGDATAEEKLCLGVNSLVCPHPDVPRPSSLTCYSKAEAAAAVDVPYSCTGVSFVALHWCPTPAWETSGDSCYLRISSQTNPEGWIYNGSVTAKRARVFDHYHDKPKHQPCFGHPIYPLTGSKGLREDLGSWSIGCQRLAMGYDTRRKVARNDPSLVFTAVPTPSFGELWESSLHKSLIFQADTSGVQRAIQASRGVGAWVSFIRDGSGNYAPDVDVPDRLVAIAGGWRYSDAAERAEETYDAQGKLLGVSYASGASMTYIYSDAATPPSVAPVAGLLIAVQDQQGRSVQFQYEQPSGVSVPRITQITDPAAQSIAVDYDASGNLSQLTWPDTKSRQYLYERGDLPWAVTGIIDENASRLATYGYDAQGRANDTQWAGGADHYSASYTSAPSWNVVETYDSTAGIIWRDHYWQLPQGTTIIKPNGSTSSVNAALVLGMPRMTSQSQPAGSGCAASTSAQSYDANGNVASKDDFNGTRTCYANDLSRNLETVRVEGLANTQSCSAVISQGSSLPTGARKTSTQWHSDWRLESKRAEPKKLTTYVYNGQPDPFNGNAVASCAPGTALLPDGKPIAVLCKTVEQATTDADGSLGFSAAVQAGVPNRVQSNTYNQHGQVLTSTDARGNTTTYSYYADTSFTGTDPNAVGHTIGDLQSVTNAAGHATQHTLYDKAGRLLQSIDANGAVTTNQYSPRGWLTQVSVTPAGGGTALITTYGYDLAGQLTSVTYPGQGPITYSYDAAHRLTGITDAAGNSVAYTLDNAGNRTGETTKDSSGTLARTVTRAFDALNRVQSSTGGLQ